LKLWVEQRNVTKCCTVGAIPRRSIHDRAEYNQYNIIITCFTNERIRLMNLVTIYTKETCPYCTRAKQLLEHEGVTQFKEIRVDLDDNDLNEMIARTGRRTVPQIYIGNVHVGGFDDLSKLKHEGKLAALLSS